MSNELKYKITLADLFSGKMGNATRAAEKMDSTMSGIGSRLKTVALGLGIAGLGKSILDTGMMFEKAEIQLKTLTGSAAAAKKVFNDIQNDALKSPFDFESLLQVDTALMAAGVSADQARQDTQGLANAIAGAGKGNEELQRMAFNLQQIKNLGKASSIDIKQFGIAGINIYKVLDDYSKKRKITLDKENITYEQITSALRVASEKGGIYYGALDNYANSTTAGISNLGDAFKQFLNKTFIALKPAINVVVAALNGLMNILSSLLPVIKLAVILWASYYIKLKLASIQSYSFALAQRAMAMGMSKSAVATGFLSRGIRGIGSAIKSVPIVGWILAIASGIEYLWDTFSGFREFIYGTIEAMRNMGTILGNTFRGLGNILAGAAKMDTKQIEMGYNQMKTGQLQTIGAAATGMKKGKDSFKASQGISAADMGGSPGAAGSDKLGSGTGSGSSSGGSTDISVGKPQNIIITINGGLIPAMTIQTTNLTESSAKVKEAVSVALMEALNDANAMARN